MSPRACERDTNTQAFQRLRKEDNLTLKTNKQTARHVFIFIYFRLREDSHPSMVMIKEPPS